MDITRRKLVLGATAASLTACRTQEPPPAGAEPAKAQDGRSGAREIAKIIASQPTTEGAGVRLRRALGHRGLGMLDPFLMLDEFQTDDPNDYLAGFPDHPHRGFETVTYMIDGAMEHKDSVGNRGRLGPGSAQWMTAGRGIVHSEMPKQERGRMWGFQLWVNLPAARKMIPPRYQDIPTDRIAQTTHEGAQVRVVAGSCLGLTGPVQGIDVDPTFIDVSLDKGALFSQPLPETHNAFVYLTQGSMRIGPSKRQVQKGELAVLGPGSRFVAEGISGGGRALVFAGRPLGEPVARYGPFVMNTDAEIQQAIDDFRSGRLVRGG